MFAIAQKSQPYNTYILSDSAAESSIDIVPGRGGMVTQWQIGSHALLYLDGDRYLDPNLSIRGGIPILFPICGNLPDDTYTHKGKTYKLPQHGFGRTLPWEVVEQSTQDAASLTLQLTSNDHTRAVYPFDFEITFTYRLLGNTLSIHQRYTNQSDEPIPDRRWEKMARGKVHRCGAAACSEHLERCERRRGMTGSFCHTEPLASRAKCSRSTTARALQ